MSHRSTAGNANTTTWLRKVLICSYRDSGAVLRECLIARKGVVVSLCLMTLSSGAVRADEPTFDFDIPEQRADDALILLGEQADATVLFQYDMATQHDANRLQGEYTLPEAVGILLADSGLKADFGAQGHLYISVDEKHGKGNDMNVKKKAGLLAALAAVFSGANSQEVADNDQNAETTEVALEEIVVIGSHIRGARSASPVFEFSRDDIDRSGAATMPQFIRRLPQNFGGGMSETTDNLVPLDMNVNRGSGINLRGLGTDSTLTLLNGRRLASAGFGGFVDISMIPISAIERVEVLTDGASAIYGSDAVGGVVNFVLRDDFEGAETRLRYGTATEGDLDDIQVGQTFSWSWSVGRALIAYEYSTRDGLDANDRSFSENAVDPTFLLGEQERHSLFLTAAHELSQSIEIFGDAFYSDRESDETQTSFGGSPESINSQTNQLGISLGLNLRLFDDWLAKISASTNENDVSQQTTPFDTGVLRNGQDFTSTTSSFDLQFDGALVDLTGGEIMLAVGVQYRHEEYNKGFPDRTTELDIDTDRNVQALFAEVFIPFVSDDNSMSGVQRLELTLAGRYEDYSDFGSSTDPKVGLLWSPIERLNLRGTWGTSFRAPLFGELDEANIAGILVGIPDPMAPTGSSVTLFAVGNNANLEPETATTWTVGFDWFTEPDSGLRLKGTFFDIEFEDKIERPPAFFDALADPRWAPLVERNPTQDLLLFYESLPFSLNFTLDSDFTDASVFVDDRLRNMARIETTGVDLSLSYLINTATGIVNFDLSGTHLFEQDEKLIETDAPVDILNTAFRPVDLKIRGSVNWQANGFSTAFTVNYVDAYNDDRVDPAIKVDSWTTADFIVSYDFGDRPGALGGLTISASGTNIFDEDPPFVAGFFESDNINFDPTNANPFGRNIALQVTKRW